MGAHERFMLCNFWPSSGQKLKIFFKVLCRRGEQRECYLVERMPLIRSYSPFWSVLVLWWIDSPSSILGFCSVLALAFWPWQRVFRTLKGFWMELEIFALLRSWFDWSENFEKQSFSIAAILLCEVMNLIVPKLTLRSRCNKVFDFHAWQFFEQCHHGLLPIFRVEFTNRSSLAGDYFVHICICGFLLSQRTITQLSVANGNLRNNL